MYVLSKNIKNIKIFNFCVRQNSLYIAWTSFRNTKPKPEELGDKMLTPGYLGINFVQKPHLNDN